MEGHRVTIEVTSKLADGAGYTDTFHTHATDPQWVKFLYHKYTNENYGDVENATGSHTLHINGDYPQVQRLVSIEPVDEVPEAMLPLRFI